MKIDKIYVLLLLILILNFVDSIAQQSGNILKSQFSQTAFTSNENSSNAIKNTKWEEILYSVEIYPNPYKDVTISVHFSNVDSSIVYDEYGFWDGGSTFIIRSYFPEVGLWTWKTTCSNLNDTGLHNRSGIINVSEYNGTNKIFSHGALKVSDNNKYLTYGDGTPFFWMGGTAWALPIAATYLEWQKYIDDRHSKKFTVVQIAPARAHGGIWEDPPYNYPTNWKGDVCFFDEDEWNPLYWQEFDKFVEYANSQEIIIAVMGLAEAVHDGTTIENAELFTRNFYARMQGYHVILSPAFDIWAASQYPIMDNIGSSLGSYSRHLISQHPGHSYDEGPINEYALYFKNKDYMNFSMNQSGHNSGDIYRIYKKVREWNVNLYNELPMVPMINTEAYYSSGRYADQIENSERKGTDENARELGWLSLLSGSLGYTYGATGIWQYGEEASPGLTIPLDSALAYISSTQMKYLVEFFSSIAWWELEPNHSAIISDGLIVEEEKMAFSISTSGKFGVAFLPNNDLLKIDMTVFSNNVDAKWFDPIHSVYLDGELNVANSGEHTYTPPYAGEWALLLSELPITLSMKIFLSGTYSSGKMNTNLSSLIPFDQPYSSLPWNYHGTQSTTSSFILNNKIVDWVLIELRSGSSAENATIVSRTAALLNEDGNVIDAEDGSTNIKFPSVDEGEYYIAVLHRNHLSVISSQKVTLTNNNSQFINLNNMNN